MRCKSAIKNKKRSTWCTVRLQLHQSFSESNSKPPFIGQCLIYSEWFTDVFALSEHFCQRHIHKFEYCQNLLMICQKWAQSHGDDFPYESKFIKLSSSTLWIEFHWLQSGWKISLLKFLVRWLASTLHIRLDSNRVTNFREHWYETAGYFLFAHHFKCILCSCR